MPNSIEELLLSVAGSGELITIVYNGGSRPGQPRQLIPVSISNQLLIAVEPASHTNKSYKLERIASVELSSGEHISNLKADPPSALSNLPSFETLLEYSKYLIPELRVAGWHIYETETSFAIATHFKNGKPRKTPSISIQYVDPNFETIFDIESGEIKTVPRELTGREKPWLVDSWRFHRGRSFSILKKAFELFIEEAQVSDPTTAKVL